MINLIDFARMLDGDFEPNDCQKELIRQIENCDDTTRLIISKPRRHILFIKEQSQ